MSEQIEVEVVYALPKRQEVLSLKVRQGTTVGQAVEQSGILKDFPEIELASAKLGIYGKKALLGDILKDRDRVEIYRPLLADPKEILKRRAAEGKVKKAAGGDADETA